MESYAKQHHFSHLPVDGVGDLCLRGRLRGAVGRQVHHLQQGAVRPPSRGPAAGARRALRRPVLSSLPPPWIPNCSPRPGRPRASCPTTRVWPSTGSARWRPGSGLGPLLEVGTYCGKSAVYLGAAARQAGACCFTVDHHRGSEENQAGWEHHDPAVVDPRTGRMDTLPWARLTIEDAGLEGDVVLVVGESTTVAGAWGHAAGPAVHRRWPRADEVAWADYGPGPRRCRRGAGLAIHDVFPDPADGRPASLRAVLRGPGLRRVGGGDGARLRQPAGPAPDA